MKILLLVLVLILSPSLLAQVSNTDLQDIRQLTNQGKYDEALKKHLWFHEESKTSAGMGGVRLSFALSQWVELGKAYPPALTALQAIRDENEAKLLGGAGGFKEYHDFFAINRTLEEHDRTYRLFRQLDQKHPDVAKQCFNVTLDLIVAHKDFDLFAKYAGDPVARFEQVRSMRETNLRLAKKIRT